MDTENANWTTQRKKYFKLLWLKSVKQRDLIQDHARLQPKIAGRTPCRARVGMTNSKPMSRISTFQRRGIVEGFFGPPWSMQHRAAIFQFGAARGMNTYLYAPKDDPYHREKWQEHYPRG